MSSSLPFPSGRACVVCQKRKSKCTPSRSSTGGACSYCARTGKICSFEGPPDRTPLTRKNLDTAERRCSQLYKLLKSLHPGLSIEAALRGPSPEAAVLDGGEDAVEAEADGEYEWHEALSKAGTSQDGMAILSTLDAGYLGSSSGSNLLQTIAALPQMHRSMSSSSRGHPTPPSVTGQFDPPEISSAAMTSYLIDAYFLFYNTSYPILHEKTFREKAANRQLLSSRASPTWRIVFYMVLAFGHWISTAQASWEYYTAARSRLSMSMLESGTIETVQAFLLVGNYLQKRDRPNTGYNFIGIAHRMALGLGLHREMATTEDTIGRERHRQLFWTMYCFDSGFNITTGRPPIILEGFIDTRLPRNIDDRDCAVGEVVPPEASYPTSYSAIIAQAKLAGLASAVYSEFLMAKTANTKIEYTVAEAMAQKLMEWKTSLPGYFTSPDVPAWFFGPRSVVLWKAQNTSLLLWRGSKPQHSFLPNKPDAQQRCVELAMQSIHDISTFCTTYEGILHMGVNWYATYFLFQATLVLEAIYVNQTPLSDDDNASFQVSISRANDCLRRLATNNVSASRCLELLEQIHNRNTAAEKASASFDPPPISASPSAVANTLQSMFPGFSSAPTLVEPNDAGGPDLELNDLASDPTLRMLVELTPLDFFDSGSHDFLFNNNATFNSGYP